MQNANKVPIDRLSDEVLRQLRELGYMESTLSVYRRTYSRIRKFLGRLGTDVYTQEAGTRFLEESSSVKKTTLRAYACAVRRLDDCANGKAYRSHHGLHHESACVTYSEVLEKFLQRSADNGNRPATIYAKKQACVLFLNHLYRNGCQDLSELNTSLVSRALLTFSNKGCYAPVRQFLRFLADERDKDLSGIVPRFRRRRVLPSAYSPDEISRVETAAAACAKTGKRNLALIRLASRMGLRVGDIAKLRLSEVDFNSGYITIIQEKTGTPVSLQMPDDVRAALKDHLNGDDRSMADGYVFHISVAPYGRITTSAIRNAIKECFTTSGIDISSRKHGPHAFRSSLASSMVNDDVSYEVVRRILGHSDPDVIMHYARADIERLRLCAIDPPSPTGRFDDYLSGREVIAHV